MSDATIDSGATICGRPMNKAIYDVMVECNRQDDDVRGETHIELPSTRMGLVRLAATALRKIEQGDAMFAAINNTGGEKE